MSPKPTVKQLAQDLDATNRRIDHVAAGFAHRVDETRGYIKHVTEDLGSRVRRFERAEKEKQKAKAWRDERLMAVLCAAVIATGGAFMAGVCAAALALVWTLLTAAPAPWEFALGAALAAWALVFIDTRDDYLRDAKRRLSSGVDLGV